MKLLCVIDSIGSGGAQRQLVSIAKGIKAKGHCVSFLVYHNEPFYIQDLIDTNVQGLVEDNVYLKLMNELKIAFNNS